VAFPFRFPHPLFIHYLLNYDKIVIQFHFLPHQNQQLSDSGIFENQNQWFLTKSNTHPTLVMNSVSITNEQVVCLPHANVYYSTKIFTFICKWIRVQANGFKRHTQSSLYMCQNRLIMWSLLKPQPTKQELRPKTIQPPLSLIVQHHNKTHHKSKWQLFY
jgi:hypothetical protein